MKLNKAQLIAALVLILLPFLIGIYLSPYFPDVMTTHWGIDGQANGYSSKNFALFFLPTLSVFLLILFLFLPKTDPYKKNFAQFKNYYRNFIYLILVFLLYIHLLTLGWNLGLRFNFIQLLIPAFAIIFYYAGILMQKAKRNWFVGIRTPWTISNEKVWQQTHSVGSKLFKVAALLSLLGIFFSNLSFYLFLFPILGVSLFLFVYSYWLYRRLA